ncbi:serine hydrolase domain-containing protein [Flagellimonas lutimaris]|uniref:serine hydrolase domain-containing protein n=1 Tax=Flagellimonas lutimaris TaxID=475082 RepID=UPI0039C2F4EA|tara:strand:- start:228 stop:1346 length:1119 start_codon:yes stop_codon:yes gene_type:complete
MNIKSKLFVVVILIFLSNCNSSVQKLDSPLVQSIDNIVAPYINSNGPGLSLLVMEKGEELISKGYGLASLELNVENDPEMIYKIGSLTKQFTATAILKLEEDGKLSIKDDIRKYLPDYPDHGYKITIENLLNHTSGIPSFTDRSDISDIEKTELTPNQLIALFKEEPLEFPSGEKYSYSDSGYVLLGLLIERLSGVTYEKYITQNLFSKAELNNTFCDNPEKLIMNRVPGYTLDSLGFKPAQYMTMKVPFAAGNLISNVNDLYTWTKTLHKGEIISKEQLSKMFTSAQVTSGEYTGYGFGTFVKTFADQRVYFHDGWIYGFISSQFYFPESDIFIAVMSNSTSIDSHEIASKIIAELFKIETSMAIDQLRWY